MCRRCCHWSQLETTIPSAIFYHREGAVLIGRKAIDAYVDGENGRLMRSLKSVLGTSLIDETTQVGRTRHTFRDVIAYYIGAVKRRAEQAAGRVFRDVVHGRPVHFVDNDAAADRKAEATLRSIIREIGFDNVTFQFEPIAAALDYERQISREEIALIADIGGGTSDFSIVRRQSGSPPQDGAPGRHSRQRRHTNWRHRFRPEIEPWRADAVARLRQRDESRRHGRAVELFPRSRDLVEHQPDV